MKAFEKWWGEDQFHRCWPSQYMRRVMEQISRKVWIAALKWVLDSDPQEGTIWDMIEKELKDA